MKLVNCPDVDRELIPYFAVILAGKPLEEISEEGLNELEMDPASPVDRYSPGYKDAQKTAEKYLEKYETYTKSPKVKRKSRRKNN